MPVLTLARLNEIHLTNIDIHLLLHRYILELSLMEYRLNVEISESEVDILTNCWDFSTSKT